MPLLDHAHIMVERPIIAENMVQWVLEPGKFSTAIVEPESEKKESDDDTEEIPIPFSVLALRAGKSVAGELLVDSVYHGWRRTLKSFSNFTLMSNAVFFMRKRKRIEEEFKNGFEERSFSMITNKFLNTTVQRHLRV